jgi:predicted TPR repeat methyltransferase
VSKQPISINDNIDAALKLDGDPEKLRDYYDDWAGTYDADVGAVDYAGPQLSTNLLSDYLSPHENLKILDAGCGTGQVGAILHGQGFRRIDGFDLSSSMADRAQQSGCYERVTGDVDIMQAAEHYAVESYDAVLCVGVFTLGHVGPQAMFPLVNLLKAGGILVVSTRNLYYDESDFQSVVDDLINSNQLTLLKQINDAPYNEDGLAHYWVFRKI